MRASDTGAASRFIPDDLLGERDSLLGYGECSPCVILSKQLPGSASACFIAIVALNMHFRAKLLRAVGKLPYPLLRGARKHTP